MWRRPEAMFLVGTALALAGAAGCRREAPAPAKREALLDARHPCTPGTGEKLGLPFRRVCPRSPTGTPDPAFWIHAVPIPCGAGQHDVVRCPAVTPLTVPARRSEPPSPVTGGLAAVMDASAAHRLCAMRFAGRLPTRTERAQARAVLGLVTLSVVESATAPAHFEYREVPEWVTERPCEQPSVLGPECGAGRAPSEATTRLDWSRIRACDAMTSGPSDPLPAIAVGESCPASDFRWSEGPSLLPCSVRAPIPESSDPFLARFRITCRSPVTESAPHPADDSTETAAVRCVVPEALLDSHSG